MAILARLLMVDYIIGAKKKVEAQLTLKRFFVEGYISKIPW